MGYYGGSSGAFELIHADEGVLRTDQLSFSVEVDSIILPTDMASQDSLKIMLRIRHIGGSAEPDFAEFWPWLGANSGSTGFLWPNCNTSVLHYMGYRIDDSGGNGLVCAMDQRNSGGADPNFWTSTDYTFSNMAALAGVTAGLTCQGYLRSAGYYDWGWAWTVHRIRAT
jgi:hypothetical protein